MKYVDSTIAWVKAHKMYTLAIGLALVMILATFGVLAASSGGPAKVPPTATAPGQPVTPTEPVPAPKPVAEKFAFGGASFTIPKLPAGVSPFTGEVVKGGPVIAFTVNNQPAARPASHLDAADIVYAYPVEGFSRLMAVYSTQYPKYVGPIRSVRETNFGILKQFGKPELVYSGAAPPIIKYMKSYKYLVPLVNTNDSSYGFWRASWNVAPHNLYENLSYSVAYAKTHNVSMPRDIGWRYSAIAPIGGKSVSKVYTKVQYTTFTLQWYNGHWVIWMDGKQVIDRDGVPIHPANIIIQHVRYAPSQFLEYNYHPPFAVSTGWGAATVLRDGKAYSCTWVRQDGNKGTTYIENSTNKQMTFKSGQTWDLMVQTSQAGT